MITRSSWNMLKAMNFLICGWILSIFCSGVASTQIVFGGNVKICEFQTVHRLVKKLCHSRTGSWNFVGILEGMLKTDTLPSQQKLSQDSAGNFFDGSLLRASNLWLSALFCVAAVSCQWLKVIVSLLSSNHFFPFWTAAFFTLSRLFLQTRGGSTLHMF